MNNPDGPKQDGRWRACAWLGFGDPVILVVGLTLFASPLVLTFFDLSQFILALLIVPALDWMAYGVLILKALQACRRSGWRTRSSSSPPRRRSCLARWSG
jgi:hypothetical protein